MNVPIQPNSYCYNEQAKDARSRSVKRFYNAAKKLLPGFTFKVHFNRGGIAVYGETYAKIYLHDSIHSKPGNVNWPVVEAYDTSMGLLVRQWDGKDSGRNHYAKTLAEFVSLVQDLSAKPFVRF